MAPPSTRPRLSALDPDDVALEVALAVFHHTQELVQSLLAPAYAGVADEPHVEALCRQTHIYAGVRRLAAYAMTGMGGPDVLSSVEPLLARLSTSVCCDRAVGSRSFQDGVEHASVLNAIICAATARDLLAADETLDAEQLAALGSVSATHIRWLSRSGELAMRDGLIAADEARRWLATRQVPGFTRTAEAVSA